MIKINITSTNKKDVESAKTLARFLTNLLKEDVGYCTVDSKFKSRFSDSDYYKLIHEYNHDYELGDSITHERKYVIRVSSK